MAAIDTLPHVRLRLSSRPDNVVLVREALRGLAEAISLDALELNDISTAVTEACNNVVSHAYEEGIGTMEVELLCSEGSLEVLVRDRGIGIGPAAYEPPDDDVEGGIGLPVIRALAARASFSEPREGGTEVSMVFAVPAATPLEAPLDLERFELSPSLPSLADDAMSVSVGPASLARPVLGRVLAALAARARFSVERIGQTRRLAEELVSHLVGASQRNRLTAGVDLSPREVMLTVGPLREGSSVDGLAPLLDRLGASHGVERTDSAEVLAVRLVEPARAR